MSHTIHCEEQCTTLLEFCFLLRTGLFSDDLSAVLPASTTSFPSSSWKASSWVKIAFGDPLAEVGRALVAACLAAPPPHRPPFPYPPFWTTPSPPSPRRRPVFNQCAPSLQPPARSPCRVALRKLLHHPLCGPPCARG